MEETPVVLTKKDAPAAAEALVKAFHEYPLIVWFHPDAEKRQSALTNGFTRMVRWAMRYGGVLATSPRMEGVVAWVYSERWHDSWWRNMLCGNYGLPFGIGRKPNHQMDDYHAYAEEIHRRAVSVPHIYVRLLGVDPAHRGKGYAGRLMRAVMEQADSEGRPCWLETQAEKNVAIYRHLGFEVVEEGMIPGGTVKSWGMLRTPPP